MLSDPVAEAFGLIHRHPSGENFFPVVQTQSFENCRFECKVHEITDNITAEEYVNFDDNIEIGDDAE